MGEITAVVILIGVIAVIVWVHHRRQRRPNGRPQLEQLYVAIEVMGNPRDGTGPDTYRAAYELVMRGIDVRLEVQELWHERGATVSYFQVGGQTHVASRTVYQTDSFKPYLGSIKSIDDFQRYVPYREDRRLILAVNPDHLQQAFAVLREAGIRLSVLHHPDQQ